MRILHPSLILLFRLHFTAFFRRMRRELKTVRGVFVMLVYMFVTLWWVPFLFLDFDNEEGEARSILPWLEQNPELAQQIPGLVLLSLCLTSIVLPSKRPGIVFKPSDIDFLFAGPYLRRELVTYKAGLILLAFVPTSLLFALISNFLTSLSWFSGFIGIFLSLSLIFLFPLNVSMLQQSAGLRLQTPVRAVAAILLLLLITVGGLHFLSRLDVADLSGPGARTLLNGLLVPLLPFTEILTAPSFTIGTVLWASLAAAINGVLFGSMLWLDADYRESSLQHTLEMKEKIGRMRKSGSPLAMFRARKSRYSLPQLPRLAGCGAIAWRQLTTAQRQSPRPLYLFLGYAVFCYLVYVLGRTDIEILGMFAPFLGMSIFIMPQWLRFDFRGDFHKMDWLKSLPLPAWAITLGQLLTPVLMSTCFYIAIFAPVAVVAQRWFLVPLVVLTVPLFTGVLFAIENLTFLLMPTAVMPSTPGDFRFALRMYMTLLIKMAILLVFLGVAGAVGGIAFWLTEMIPFALVLGSLVLSGEVLLLVYAVAVAFNRFDISKMPPS